MAGEMKNLDIYTQAVRNKIIRAWYGSKGRVKFGRSVATIKACPGGVGLYLRGNTMRDFISSKTIGGYIDKLPSVRKRAIMTMNWKHM